MRTIAITIDDAMLKRVDRIAARREGATNRSKVIRAAVTWYRDRLERTPTQERERQALRRHRTRLNRQAAALVKEQAKP